MSRSKSGALLSEFKDVVASRGESAAVEWISRRLERDEGGEAGGRGRQQHQQRPRSASTPRERGGGDLLSSVIPPLTPRSRPGSRAASPERGGGGGLLVSQSLGRDLDSAAALLAGGAGVGRGKRMTTPLPKQLNKGGGSGGNIADAGAEGAIASGGGGGGAVVEHEYLVAAASGVPNEYGTELASYVVRRPYLESRSGEDGDGGSAFREHGHLATDGGYALSADAMDPSTLEVVAYIEADGSVFTLSGRSDVRHGKSGVVVDGPRGTSFDEYEGDRDGDGGEYDWAVFDDVEGMDRALGRVTYIDVEGNERDYWLGEFLFSRWNACRVCACCRSKSPHALVGCISSPDPIAQNRKTRSTRRRSRRGNRTAWP